MKKSILFLAFLGILVGSVPAKADFCEGLKQYSSELEAEYYYIEGQIRLGSSGGLVPYVDGSYRPLNEVKLEEISQSLSQVEFELSFNDCLTYE